MIRVRLLRDVDMPAVLALASQPHVRKALALDDLEVTRERAEAVLMQTEPGTKAQAFGIFGEDDTLLGVMSLVNQHEVHRTATITNLAAERHAAPAIGDEAMEWIVDYAFNVRNLNRLECRVLQDNRVTPRLIMRVRGATKEGVLRQCMFRHGKYIDVAIYSLLKEEWDGSDTVSG